MTVCEICGTCNEALWFVPRKELSAKPCWLCNRCDEWLASCGSDVPVPERVGGLIVALFSKGYTVRASTRMVGLAVQAEKHGPSVLVNLTPQQQVELDAYLEGAK